MSGHFTAVECAREHGQITGGYPLAENVTYAEALAAAARHGDYTAVIDTRDFRVVGLFGYRVFFRTRMRDFGRGPKRPSVYVAASRRRGGEISHEPNWEWT